ncbi:carbon-nitrogen hydrolase [Thozetella sp. PMI_491]|nr:carbon-nitrogen hydrolase [Thozetella sp. PMI_491]
MPRIGCLQFAPQVGDVDNNLNRADSLLNRANSLDLDSLDLLVLPEMAFSGYDFKSLQHITPYLEPSGSGITSLWARTTALKHDCVVAVGYPEKVDMSRSRSGAPEYYNSLIVVNGNGETVANYRKSFLYYTDETWALEGGGFFKGEIDSLGKVAMGICMDINPYKFQAPWNKFEFAVHVQEVRANLVILSMAWLTQENSATFTPLTDEPDMETLSYWIQRLEPVIRKESEEEVIVVFCNRCGMEGETTYAGTSAVIGIQNGEVSVYGLMGRGVKELLVVDTELPPFAKLINRPEETNEASQTAREQGEASPKEAVPSPARQDTPAIQQQGTPSPTRPTPPRQNTPATAPQGMPSPTRQAPPRQDTPAIQHSGAPSPTYRAPPRQDTPGIQQYGAPSPTYRAPVRQDTPGFSSATPSPTYRVPIRQDSSGFSSPGIPSPVRQASIASDEPQVVAIQVSQDFDRSESECEDNTMPRSGAPMILPSPAPQFEVIEECPTDEDGTCSSDCRSECGSDTDGETPIGGQSPPPLSARPKLEISTGPEALSPIRRQPPGPGSFFAGQHHPISSLGEGPHSALPKTNPYWDPRSGIPDIAEDTNWSPLLTGSTMTHRSPWDTELRAFARSPASRPSSRTAPKIASPGFDVRSSRSVMDRSFDRPPLSPPPLSPRSPTSNFSRPFKPVEPVSVPQFVELPANTIPILASPSVFQTTFPRSASAFQEHFASLNEAANEDLGFAAMRRRGRSKSVSALSPKSPKPSEEAAPRLPDFPRPPSRHAIDRPKRSPTKTPPPLSSGIKRHIAHSPTHRQFSSVPEIPQVPSLPHPSDRVFRSRTPSLGERSAKPGYSVPQSPVEFRAPIWT